MFRFALTIVCLMTLAACGAQDKPVAPVKEAVASEVPDITTETEAAAPITIQNAYVRKPLIGQNVTAAYFDVTSGLDSDALIVGVYADRAETAELHTHIMENGMMAMRRVDNVTVPAHSTVQFKPMSNHIMLFEVDPALAEGDIVQMHLDVFSDGNTERLSFEAPVRPLN